MDLNFFCLVLAVVCLGAHGEIDSLLTRGKLAALLPKEVKMLLSSQHVQTPSYNGNENFFPKQTYVPEDVYKEMKMNIEERVAWRGFPLQAHDVTTKDGYILTIHRIPYGRNGNTGGRRPVVFISHGLDGKSDTWLKDFPHNTLPYLLADAGFDVWLNNMRGNVFSLKHTKYDCWKDREYWQFSFDHVAKFDLPAIFDHILSTTGNQKLFYVGHSLGTTAAFAAFTTYPETAAKVKIFVGLAPVARVKNIKEGIIPHVVHLADTINDLLDLMGHIGFIGSHTQGDVDEVARECNEGIRPNRCETTMMITGGYTDEFINRTRIPVYNHHGSGGTSVRMIHHLAQGINDGVFKMYNFGPIGNMAAYGSPVEPKYDLTKLAVPTAIYWSEIDYLSNKDDVLWLFQQLRWNATRSSAHPGKLSNGGTIRRLGPVEESAIRTGRASPVFYVKHMDKYHHFNYNMAVDATERYHNELIKLFKENS